MKKLNKIILLIFILSPLSANAGVYANTNFRPYLGIDIGLNIADYTYNTNLSDTYSSATINAGARIGQTFGAELFFTHSSTNNLEFIYDLNAINHEIYYIAFGFDIFAYYNITKDINIFTTFGVANYKIYNKYEYITETSETNSKTSDSNVTTRIGIGGMYTFPGNKVSAHIQYHYTPINNELISTMSEFTFGIRYAF